MKLYCKCGKQLTEDLCKVKEFSLKDQGEYNQVAIGGFFIEWKAEPPTNNKWHENHPAQIWKGRKRMIEVPEASVIIDIPPMPSGWGCCNWSGGYLLCDCGNTLGTMYLDCYEYKTIDFLEENVVRVYV